MMRISPNAVGRRTKGSLRLLLYLLCAALPVGCTQKSTAPPADGTPPLLDNHGGFSHGGRRVVLLPDGSYSDTTYTDVLDAKPTMTRGVYTLSADRMHLILTPESGAAEHLYRVDYRQEQYWVHEEDQHRVTEASETELRQSSLRTGDR
jgi:hypothetical protein